MNYFNVVFVLVLFYKKLLMFMVLSNLAKNLISYLLQWDEKLFCNMTAKASRAYMESTEASYNLNNKLFNELDSNGQVLH